MFQWTIKRGMLEGGRGCHPYRLFNHSTNIYECYPSLDFCLTIIWYITWYCASSSSWRLLVVVQCHCAVHSPATPHWWPCCCNWSTSLVSSWKSMVNGAALILDGVSHIDTSWYESSTIFFCTLKGLTTVKNSQAPCGACHWGVYLASTSSSPNNWVVLISVWRVSISSIHLFLQVLSYSWCVSELGSLVRYHHSSPYWRHHVGLRKMGLLYLNLIALLSVFIVGAFCEPDI
jgi:hypothetical protein